MSIANALSGKTDPILNLSVTLSQYIKITKASQLLGTFNMVINPGSECLTLAFQVPGSQPVLSIPLKANFSFTIQDKLQWSINYPSNKFWIVEFREPKDFARAICAVGLVLNYKSDDKEVIKYDLPGQERTGKEVGNGDRVQISYYVYTFGEFPYIDKMLANKENVKTKLSSQHLAKGFVQGIVGMTCNSSRAIFVPPSMAASDHRDQINPIDNVMFYVTLKHAKYSGDGGESEHTETEVDQDGPLESQNSQSDSHHDDAKPAPEPTPKPIVEKPVVEKPVVEKPIVEKPVVEKPPPEKSAPEPKSDFRSKLALIGSTMPGGGMMGMPMSYEKKRRASQAEPKDDSSEQDNNNNNNSQHDNTESSKNEDEEVTSSSEPKTTETATKSPQNFPKASFSASTTGGVPRGSFSSSSGAPSGQSAFQQAAALAAANISSSGSGNISTTTTTTPPSTTASSNASSASAAANKKSLFDEPRESNRDLLERIENLERIVDQKLGLVCGTNSEVVDPDSVIRGISSLAVQLKMKTAECETIRKQLSQVKAKASGAAASNRQLDNAKNELAEAKQLKASLEAKVRASDTKLNELERASLAAVETAGKNGTAFVKSMMSKVFDDMNTSFSESGVYSGKEVSDLLYALLRKHAFSSIEDVKTNGLF